MNANELADILQQSDFLAMDFAEDAATMLRQQQAEIEALKQIIDANNLNQNIGQFVKSTNEPVAWINKESNTTMIGQTKPPPSYVNNKLK